MMNRREMQMALSNHLRSLGGEGSGNFGHAGIPGQQGGSQAGSGGGELITPSDPEFNQDDAMKGITSAIHPFSESVDMSEVYGSYGKNKYDIDALEIEEAKSEFFKSIRKDKKSPEKLVAKLKEIVTSSKNSKEQRIIGDYFTKLYANRLGIPNDFNASIDDVVKGTVPESVFDPFYKKVTS